MKKKIAMERLPLYDMVIDENDDLSGIKFLSIVENPAIEVTGYAFSDYEFKKRKWQKRKGEIKRNQSNAVGFMPPCHFDSDGVANCNCFINEKGEWIAQPDACAFCKNNQQYYIDNNFGFTDNLFSVNVDEQIIAGPAMIPHKPIYRKDEDGEYYVRFSPEVIANSVKKFVRNNNNKAIDVEHSHNMVKAFIMEHWIIRDSVYDASTTYGFTDLPVGTWFVVMKIDDPEFWQEQVKGEGKQSFSIEINAGRKLVKMSDVPENPDLETVLDTLNDDEFIDILKDVFSENEKSKK